MIKLKCPVCDKELIKIDKSYVCPKKHSYDIAKKNYVNLILANQGHHLNEGDSKDMIDARRRFLNSGHYHILLDTLINIIRLLSSTIENPSFCDIACGEGYYTNAIAKEINIPSLGIDISKSAIQASASSRNMMGLNNIEYVIGNMDYLPLLDESIAILLNCFAPINEIEFNRVLVKEGYYIRVLPDVYHLFELKKFLYNDVRLNEPKEPNIFGLSLVDEIHIEDNIHLNNQEIQDLFTMTPYYYKTSVEAKERLKNLENLDTKIAFVIRIYKK